MLIKKDLYIKHDIPGRIRFKANAIKKNKNFASELSNKIKSIEGIFCLRINYSCASLVVQYNSGILTRDYLIEQIQQCFPSSDQTVLKKSKGSSSLKMALARFIGLSAVVAVVFVKEVIYKKPLAQNFFSPLGIITALSALPLLKKGIESFKEKRFTLESFLGASVMVASAAGEATASLEILWITSGGQLLQAWITERSRNSIRDILQITTKNTYLLIDGCEVEIPVDEVKYGDNIVVHTGERIPVDGKIINGTAVVDESTINGRAEHATKYVGDSVLASTFVCQGVIYVKAEKIGDDTYISKIIQMVEDSLENKAPIEGVAEKLAANLIKLGFVVTFGTLVLTQSLWRAFTVMLVMACPCATILSASTAISAALSAAAKRQILIKGGRYLEEVGQVDVVCFDKTGTLTTNKPEIRKFINVSDEPEEKLLQLAYSAEMHNLHPIAKAIKIEAKRRDIEPIIHEKCEYMLGKGVEAIFYGKKVLVGNLKLMKQFDIDTNSVDDVINVFKKQGLTTVFIAQEKTLLGLIGFANQDRPNAKLVINRLMQDGVEKVAMITGDEKYSATHLAKELNIQECFSSVMPEQKADIVNKLRNNGSKVLMIGDGINDALALAEADIGIAMGAGGSEVAIEAADIALVQDSLVDILYIRSLSNETLKIVNQNFWIASGSNIVGVVMGAIGALSPVTAGLIHIVHTLGILLNSGRLLAFKQDQLKNLLE